jgi:hypothetical protein
MYVSDYLETLLDGSRVRQFVRSECEALVERLPPRLHEHLQPIASYIGGKCMGYPAVWFIQAALGADDSALVRALRRSPTALFVSLSTSIADDFLDRNEAVHGAHLTFMYLLLLEPLTRRERCSPSAARALMEEVVDVIDLFVGPQSVGEERAVHAASQLQPTSARRGKRIGNFHAAIAAEVLEELGAPESSRKEIIEATRLFGEWCALLDDVIDIEQDIEERIVDSFPIAAMINHFPEARPVVFRRDIAGLGELLVAPELSETLVERLISDLDYIESVTPAASPVFGEKFSEIRERLQSGIGSLRRRAHEEAVERMCGPAAEPLDAAPA